MSEAHAHNFDSDVCEPALEGTFNGKLAMWLFLCSEVMFFAGMIGAYMTLRIGHPENFEASQKHLHDSVGFAAVNTALLITSSLTMALGVLAGQRKQTAKQRLLILVTAGLGMCFLCLKSYEYSLKIRDGFLPNHDLFFSFYWTLTAIHGIHILGGIIPMLGIWWMARRKDMTGETEMIGLYWHFVDLVWIFLFPLLYLI